MNGLSKNNKDAVKNLIQQKDVSSVENKLNSERTDKATSEKKAVIYCRGQYHKALKW